MLLLPYVSACENEKKKKIEKKTYKQHCCDCQDPQEFVKNGPNMMEPMTFLREFDVKAYSYSGGI